MASMTTIIGLGPAGVTPVMPAMKVLFCPVMATPVPLGAVPRRRVLVSAVTPWWPMAMLWLPESWLPAR